jgi:hypothetical protein
MFFSDEPAESRAFIRDKLQIASTDLGHGWLIFHGLEADLGVHPLNDSGSPPTGIHDISLYCDDLESEVAAMRERGVEFQDEIEDQGFGFVSHLTIPGDIKVTLYQPKYK